jgi:hypothetical protein
MRPFPTLHLRWALLFVIIATLRFLTVVSPAAEAMEPFEANLRSLFSEYYPAVTVSVEDKKITFDHDTRLFTFPMPKRKDSSKETFNLEERGPNPGGILCEIIKQPGHYRGAAVVPLTLDRPYGQFLLLAPYSKEMDLHLQVRLYYRPGTDPRFMGKFIELVNSFAK